MGINTNYRIQKAELKVIRIRDLTPTAYVIRFDRKGIPFRAGQHILLGIKGEIDTREYSVYSAEQDEFFEVLVREVKDGIVSNQLRKLKPGDPLNFENPVGYFIIRDEDIHTGKFLFIASGTGIGPFHSFVKTYPGLDYKLLHGIRYGYEAFDKDDYDKNRMVRCTSRNRKGDFHGRVTDYLRKHPVTDKNTLCYFCGNVEMIHEAYDIMLQQGIPSQNLFAEVYF